MLRNIHFFHIKPGADEARMLSLMDNELAAYAKTFGCLERKTWRLLDAHVQGEPAEAAAFMNEALWPSFAAADAFTHAERPEAYRRVLDELLGGVEIEKTVRYVDDEG